MLCIYRLPKSGKASRGRKSGAEEFENDFSGDDAAGLLTVTEIDTGTSMKVTGKTMQVCIV